MQYLHDFHPYTSNFENEDKTIMFMNLRLYQMNFRRGRDIYLYTDVSINKIYRALRYLEVLQINLMKFSVSKIRKSLGAIYRSRIRRCIVYLNESQQMLVFQIDHAVLLIRQEDLDSQVITYSLIQE